MMLSRHRKWVYRIFAIAALLNYVFIISFPSFHTITHESNEIKDDIIECVEDHEHPCHDYLFYSQDLECKHKDHISDSHDHCELCATFAFTFSYFNYSSANHNSAHNFITESFFLEENYTLLTCFHENVRGPPLG